MSHDRTLKILKEVLTEYPNLTTFELGEVVYELTKDCYKCKPVNIDQFITDDYFLGKTMKDMIFPFWLEFLKTLYPHSMLTMYNEIALSCATGCHGIGTKILMYEGSIKNVENVVVGDLLMGDDGTPRKVLSLARGRENMYKVTPRRGGEPFVCNESHILSLEVSGNKLRSIKYKDGNIINISIKDYLEESNQFKHLTKLYRRPVDFIEQAIELDPYILGLWVGDGNSSHPALTTMDIDISNIWNNYGEKRIHPKYLRNSREVRLKLLAGIVDSDGYVYGNNKNMLNIVTELKGLSEDYAYLCRSLGYQTTVTKVTKGIKKINFKGEYYSVFVSGNLEEIPTTLTRRQLGSKKINKDPLRTGFSIDFLKEDDYYGFELDGNHLYLLGDFTVTHNTGKSAVSTLSLAYEAYKLLCLKNPHDFYRLQSNDMFTLGLFAPTHAQAASVTFTKLLGYFSNSDFFREMKAVPKARSSVSQEGVSLNDFIMLHTGSSLNQALGKATFSAVIDEVAYFQGKDPTASVKELHVGLRDRRRSRFPLFGDTTPGVIWLVSSPKDEQDYLNEAIEKIKTNPWGAYFENIPRWEVHGERGGYLGDKFKLFLGDEKRDPFVIEDEKVITPSMEHKIIEVPMEHKRDFEDSTVRAIRDIAGIRIQADTSLFKSKEQVRNLFINPNRFKQDIVQMSFSDPMEKLEDFVTNINYFKKPLHPNSYRFIHLDIATKKDKFGFAAVYSTIEELELSSPNSENITAPRITKKERMYYVDFAVAIEAKKGEEINIFKVIDFIFLLKKLGYPIKTVSSDMFQGDVTRQFLKLHGTNTQYLSVDRTKDPYYSLKELINTSKIIGVKNEFLIKELLGLRDLEKKIDHLPTNSKDLADALTGALFSCINSKEYISNHDVYSHIVKNDIKHEDLGELSKMMKDSQKNKFKDNINKFWNV
jgi:hypothetical protein